MHVFICGEQRATLCSLFFHIYMDSGDWVQVPLPAKLSFLTAAFLLLLYLITSLKYYKTNFPKSQTPHLTLFTVSRIKATPEIGNTGGSHRPLLTLSWWANQPVPAPLAAFMTPWWTSLLEMPFPGTSSLLFLKTYFEIMHLLLVVKGPTLITKAFPQMSYISSQFSLFCLECMKIPWHSFPPRQRLMFILGPSLISFPLPRLLPFSFLAYHFTQDGEMNSLVSSFIATNSGSNPKLHSIKP